MLLEIESVRYEQLRGTLEAHRLAGPGVQFPSDRIQLRLRANPAVSLEPRQSVEADSIPSRSPPVRFPSLGERLRPDGPAHSDHGAAFVALQGGQSRELTREVQQRLHFEGRFDAYELFSVR